MITFLDGAMGTQLQNRGLQPGEIPELWNLTRPADITAVHRAYLEAGADIVSTNTFGANPAKYHGDAPLKDVIAAAVHCARDAGAKRVALDVGPTGRLLKPAGDFEFDAAYDAFAEQIRLGAEAGADLVFLETFGDTYELKAALLAAKENAKLPILASVALGEDGKLLTGADVDTIAALFNALKPDAAGFNCGFGPDRLLPFLKRFAERTNLPIIAKPNAGLPKVVDGKTVFTVGPEEFARDVAACIEAGATYVGGCCGTTPRHIAAIKRTEDIKRETRTLPTVVSSYSRAVELPFDDSIVIGERINPTGKKKLREAYKSGDTGYILREAIAQVEAGAAILDVNAGVPGLDEPQVLRTTVEAIQSVTDTPLQIDTADPVALENALRHYNGKAMVNSVNAKEESMNAVFPIVAKYGGVLVALTLDENGIPPTADGRLALAKKIIDRGAEYGLTKDDFVIDVLCLATSADPSSASVILESLRRIRAELGVRTVLGVSNISFGLPERAHLNRTFLAMAFERGLDIPIMNPLDRDIVQTVRAFNALSGIDANCERYIAFNTAGNATEQADDLFHAVVAGLRDTVGRHIEHELQTATPESIISDVLIPALTEVGERFEKKTVFLPQLIQSAEAAKAAFEILSTRYARNDAGHKGTVVIATVKGDVHDIGKNIVKVVMQSHGYKVVDLGKNVDKETVAEACRRHNPMAVGLSALMTTTVDAMEDTIRHLRSLGIGLPVMVGGAVLTEEIAAHIGADYYAQDALTSVGILEKIRQ